MTAWSALPAWMRRVPLVGWLAGAVAILALLWLRARRQAAAASAHAEAVATAARARQKLAAVEHRAQADHLVERQALRQEEADAQDRAEAARERVEALRGADLAAEVSRVFGGRK